MSETTEKHEGFNPDTMHEMFNGLRAQRAEFAAKETVGERFEVPREGKASVSTILYRPVASSVGKELPVLFHMHGGAWIGADAVLLESFCQLLADEIPAFVVNVNYKKADEHPFPYAAEEVADAVKYFALHAEGYGIDKEKMAVGGHSAGGQISASAALMLKDAGIDLACQMLVYPALNMSDFATGMLKDLLPVFFPNGGWDHPYNSPILASDEQLAGIAPAIFILCGPDMLKPQGAAYAKRLIDVGVPVKVKEYAKAEHGFLEVNRPDYTQGDPRQTPEQAAYTRDCEQYLIRELRACFGG